MANNVIKFKTQPHNKAEYNDRFEKDVIEWTEETANLVKERLNGKIIFGAIVLINDKADCVTSFQGRAHIFTTIGALDHLADRVRNETGHDDDEDDHE